MILVRHGQSEFNVVYSVTRVDPGIPDPKLTDQGRRQAQDVAAALAPHGLTRIVASPYTRALETAEIIAAALRLELQHRAPGARTLPLSLRYRLARFASGGALAGFDFSHLPERWWPDLDETEEQLAARSQDFRRAMAAHSTWRSTAVVTHWGFIRALTGQRVPNAHLLRFDPHSGEARDLAPPAVP